MPGQLLHNAARPEVNVESTGDVLATLDRHGLSMFTDRVAALSARFDKVAQEAAELCEPAMQFVSVPRRTLKSNDEIDAWAGEAKEQLKSAPAKGPVAIK